MGIAAAVAGGSALLGAGASIYGASKQAGATRDATRAQREMFDIMQKNLGPYNQWGQDSMGMLMGRMGELTHQFAPTMEELEKTPGYQFTRDQGMKAVNNSNSAMGWGSSGPGAKGIADYVTGLASGTYQQQFNNYWTGNKNVYDMLMGPAQLGENAAAGIGSGAIQTGANIGSNMIGAGNAWAGGAVGAANSLMSAGPNYLAMMQMLKGQGGGGTGWDGHQNFYMGS